MPEVSALEIIELYEAGIININHTRVINENDFDFIVNATGQNSNIEECQNTLYKNLLSSGTIKSDTSITRKNSITSNMKVPNPTIEANINDEFKNNDGVKREFKSLQTYNKKNNKNKDLYSIGVASANFGSSRASRVIDNGKNIAKQITL